MARLSVPAAILVVGYFAYTNLAVEAPEEREKGDQERSIKTRVADLESSDYRVEIVSQGDVESHNEISLSAMVSGQIVKLSSNFEVGSYFSKDDVLIEIDDRDYRASANAAQAALQSAKSGLDLAKIEHERTTEGFEGGQLSVVTKAEVDQTAAALARAEAALNEASAALDQAKLDLERTKIKAPFDGRVRYKNVGLGQTISPGTVAAVIFAVDYAEVRLPITTRDQRYLTLPEMEGSESITVELRDAIDTRSERRWTGEIVRTEGALDPGSLELIAIARINDPFGLESGEPPLRIGQPVKARIEGALLENVVSIPRGAVRELDQIILVDKTTNFLTKATIDPLWSDEETLICAYSDAYRNAWVATTHIVYAPEGAPVEVITDSPTIDDPPEPETETETST